MKKKNNLRPLRVTQRVSRLFLYVIGMLVASIHTNNLSAQGVSINESGNAPDPSAILEVQPDVNFNKGLLLPRLTTAQRNTIPSPVEGLIIYNTTTDCFEIYNGSVWYSVGCQCSGAPAATTASAATSVASGSFTANWGAVTDATTFYIDVATDAGFTSILPGYNNLNVGNVTSYSVSGLSCSTTYYYRLRAANPCGTSASSNTINPTTAASAPAAPTASAATSTTGSSFSANWSNTGGTTYYLDVATNVGFTSFVSGYNNLDAGNVTTYSVTGLGCNSTYYYRVRAYSSCGTSASSNTITATTGTSAPSAVAATAATSVTGGSFTANWNSAGDATTYYLDVATDAGFTSFVSGYNNLDAGNVTTYNITGLGCNTTYYYRVRTANGCGSSASSNTITQATGSTAPSAPTASSASDHTCPSFTANWGAVGSATKYYLDAAYDAGFTSFVTGFNDLDVGNVTSYSVTGLNGSTTYYRVRAYNPCGTSVSSNTITVTPACASLTSWTYKVPVTISNGGGALTNYQVKITMDTQTLVTAGKMQTSGADIRVTDTDKCTALPFWIETGTMNSATTNIWVKMSSLSAGSTTIYVYYGNGAASTLSSGTSTFDFFDDFSSFDAAKWTATGAYSVASGEITITTGSVYSNSVASSQADVITEAKARWIAPMSGSYSGLCIANAQSTSGSNGGSNKLVYLMTNSGGATVQSWAANGTAASYNITSGVTQFTATSGTNYILGHAVNSTNVIFYNNRTATNSYAGTWSGNFYLWLGYFTGSAAGTNNITDIAVDWVLLRKYAATIPTTSGGAEESACY